MTNPPIGTPASQQGASSQAIVALIVGILSLVTGCLLLSPVAWYLGSQEIKSIRAGRSPAAGEGVAKAGWILGILGTVLFLLGLVFVFFFGGLAILGSWWGAQGG